MKAMPKIGARVAYKSTLCGEVRECTGVVVAQYPGYGEKHCNEETGEIWISADHVGVKVDQLPKWWGRPGDRFAPDIADLKLIK